MDDDTNKNYNDLTSPDLLIKQHCKATILHLVLPHPETIFNDVLSFVPYYANILRF